MYATNSVGRGVIPEAEKGQFHTRLGGFEDLLFTAVCEIHVRGSDNKPTSTGKEVLLEKKGMARRVDFDEGFRPVLTRTRERVV